MEKLNIMRLQQVDQREQQGQWQDVYVFRSV